MTTTIIHPSGAIEVSGTDAEGYLVTLTFYGYTRREAVAEWKRTAPTYWRDQIAQENANTRRTFRHA